MGGVRRSPKRPNPPTTTAQKALPEATFLHRHISVMERCWLDVASKLASPALRVLPLDCVAASAGRAGAWLSRAMREAERGRRQPAQSERSAQQGPRQAGRAARDTGYAASPVTSLAALHARASCRRPSLLPPGGWLGSGAAKNRATRQEEAVSLAMVGAPISGGEDDKANVHDPPEALPVPR